MQTIHQIFKLFIIAPIALVLFIVNFIAHGLMILIIGLISWPLPKKSFVFRIARATIDRISILWYQCSYHILQLTSRGKWQIQGDARLSNKNWYLLISNHQSWMDILVIGCLLRNDIPSLRFFMKKELVWSLPIAGICCYFMGFPLMSRHSKKQIQKKPSLKGKDIETTRKACQQLKTAPVTIINFVEGTRFTKAKHDAQQSPYTNLLKPKSGGVATAINQLHDVLDGIIDVTIHYNATKISFIRLFFGCFNSIKLTYTKHDVSPDIVGNYFEDREFRSNFQKWLNSIWQTKDKQLNELK